MRSSVCNSRASERGGVKNTTRVLCAARPLGWRHHQNQANYIISLVPGPLHFSLFAVIALLVWALPALRGVMRIQRAMAGAALSLKHWRGFRDPRI